MDTVTGALHSADGQHILHPQTQIKQVVNLQTELNKIIKAISISGGTITLTKIDGTTFTATIGTASTTSAGLMSSSDKSKLDGIAASANNYSLPTASSSTLGGVKVGSGLSISNGVLSATVSGGSSGVTGVKGNSESSYRTGNVNLTAANIGAATSSHNHSATEITSGTLPVARGGTGQTSLANVTGVGSANKLTTARTIQINLASTSSASFDGSANVTPGVTGILPAANGGTGYNSLSNVKVGFSQVADTLNLDSPNHLNNVNLDEFFSNVSGRYTQALGVYNCWNTCTNLPISMNKNACLINAQLLGGYRQIIQIFLSHNETTTANYYNVLGMFIRVGEYLSNSNKSWSSWFRLTPTVSEQMAGKTHPTY